MTRSTFRRLWLLGLLLIVATSLFVYRKAETLDKEISYAEIQRASLEEELNLGSQISADLATLDSLTINERESTKLSVLRNLNLENTNLTFEIQSKVEQVIGAATLFSRRYVFRGALPYADALTQIDQLHNTKKAVIDSIFIQPDQQAGGDVVSFEVGGVVYGLEKQAE